MAHPIYFVEVWLPNLRAKTFIEVDRDTHSLSYIQELIRSREIDPIKILEVIEDEGRVSDITAEVLENCQLQQAAE
jgi:hypothetical protein